MAIILLKIPSTVSFSSFSFPAISVHSFKFSKSLIISLLILVAGVENTFANDYYQRQSGNWNNPGTWTTSNAWQATVNTGTYPQAGDNVHLANNGNLASITLSADAQCTNLLFEGSEPSCVIAQGNYNLIVSGTWTTNWTSNVTITQGSGYLQINGGIPTFYYTETINNFRVGSSSFYFSLTNSIYLIVTSNYDYNCYESIIPTGITASAATKSNISTLCSPSLTTTALTGYGSVCTGTTIGPNSFTISGLALTSSNVTVASLTGFIYSTTANGSYTSTLTLPQPGGHYSQTIYVEFSPRDAISYNGNIVVGGGGASSINVAAVGSGVTSVIPTLTTPTSANITSTTATLGGNITLDGCSSQSITERGVYYSTTNGFANGAGTKVSETGTFGTGAFTENVTGLLPSTTYYYKSYATNSAGTGYSSQGTFNNVPLTFSSMQSGNWTDPSTWTTAGCGGTTNSGTYPGYGDNVVICQSHNITVNTTGLSCNNIDMTAYATHLTLNNNFTINGNLTLGFQSYVSMGILNLAINGDFSNTNNPYFSRIEYSSGNLTIGGKIDAGVGSGGIQPFICSGSGWLIMSGTAKTFTANDAISIPNFRQPTTGFTKAGGSTLTVSTVFDQNCGPVAPSGVTISIPGNTINSACSPNKQFRSVTSGSWSATSTWNQSTDGGTTWSTTTAAPIITDGPVSIQSGHTVTLNAAAAASSLTINGSLNLGTYTLTGSNAFTIASGGTLLVGGTSNFPTGFNTVTLSSGSTVNYNNSGVQTVFPATYTNLTLSGSGSKTTTGVTVTGILSLEGTATTTGTIVPNVTTTTLQYNGTGAQIITDNLLLENKTYNLSIANTSAGVNQTTDFTANNNLTVNSGAALTIQPAKTLTVGGTITNSAGTSGIVIKASPTLANGSLIFSQPALNPSVPATVEMYSKAAALTPGTPPTNFRWQFFGIPLHSLSPLSPTLDGAYVRLMHENDSPFHWEQLNNTSSMTSFKGYEITQTTPTTYIFQGLLENAPLTNLQLTFTTTTPAVSYPGQNLIGNPYTAAIEISQIEFSGNVLKTIYIYNTGSKADWTSKSGDSIDSNITAGQYTAIPQAWAGNAGLQYEIPSMQAFLVKTKDNTGTISIPYSSVGTVVPNTFALRAPGLLNSDVSSDKVWTIIDVKGSRFSDRMWIFTEPGCTHGFDNGWDGEKFMGSSLTPQIYAMEQDGNYQVNSVDDINNTYLGFRAGEDSVYTLTFTHQNMGLKYGNVYLVDSVAQHTVDITASGTQYTFMSLPTDTIEKRFKIITNTDITTNVITPVSGSTQLNVFSSRHTVYIDNKSDETGSLYLYDMTGRCIHIYNFTAQGVTTIPTDLSTGIYLAKGITKSRIITKNIIL